METEINNFAKHSEHSEQGLDDLDLKWLVSELLIELEKYDDLKEKYDEVKDELNEDDDEEDDDEKLEPRERRKLQMKLKVCQRDTERKENFLQKKWKVIEVFVENDDHMKRSSSGDTYFMTSVFRLRKEIFDMMNQ